MKSFINENNKKYDWVFLWVTTVIIIRIVIYAVIAITGFGTIPLRAYFGILINIMMFLSIMKYMVSGFKLGKEVSLEPILIRFAISLCTFTLSAKDEEAVLFALSVILLMFTPYVASAQNTASPKKNFIMMTGLYVLSLALTIAKIAYPIDNYIKGLNKAMYYLDACNILIESTLFYVLTILRIKVQDRDCKKEKL